MKMRSHVCLDLEDGRRLIGPTKYPRWLLRWLFRRSAAGFGPVILISSAADGRSVEVQPGTIKHALVAAYEGDQ